MALTSSEKKLLAVCALALAIPLGVAVFINHINATPTIAVAPPAIAPQPNGYDLYVRASNAIKEAKPSVDPNLDLKIPTDPKVRAARYSVGRKDAWLKQNKAGFDLFEKAQKAQSQAPPYGADSQGRALRQMARYKVIESNAHWQRGDHGAALQSGLDIMQLGYDVQRGGDVMDTLVGTAIGALSVRSTGDTIEHLDAKQARAAARRVEQLLATRQTLDEAFIEEKARLQQDWLKYFAHPDWRADFVRSCEQSNQMWGDEPLSWKQRALIRTTSKRRILSDHDIVYERAISNARLPYGRKREPETAVGNPFVDIISDYLGRRFFSSARALTAHRVLMLRLALRAYQLEHGAPPPNLQTLVPTYIRAVPADPFGQGEPFRYRTNSQTYTLWSIGPDGRNDGGTPISWPKNRKKNIKNYADEREKLPAILRESDTGDYVAGKNH